VRIAAGVLGCRAGPVGVEVVGWLASSRPAGLGMAAAGQQLGRVFGATAGQHPGHPPAPRPRCPPDRHQATQRSAASPALFTLSGEPLRTILPREKVLLHHRPPAARPWLAPVAVEVVGLVAAGPVAAHRLACDALACSGSTTAQGLRVVRLVPVRSVSGLPLAWAQRPVAGALDRTGPRGASPGGAVGCRSGGVAHQLAPCRVGVGTRGNCSDRLRQPVGPSGAQGVRVCSAVGMVAPGR
jgi:hypothetical protein